MTEPIYKPIKGLSFQVFKDTILANCIQFKEGASWDDEQWNKEYIGFRECVSSWKDDYRDSLLCEEIICEWAWNEYGGTSFDTHDHRVFKKVNGWYDLSVTVPEELVGYYVYIAESDMQAVAVYEQAAGGWWLDFTNEKMEVVDPGAPELGALKVTHFRPMLRSPKTP